MAQYADMQVNPHRPYTALHMRTLLLNGDNGANQPHTMEIEDAAMSYMLCAKSMAMECNVDLSINPIVMVTDDVRLRRRVVAGLYRGLVAANITPHHFDSDANA